MDKRNVNKGTETKEPSLLVPIASFIAYVTKGDRDNPGEIDHPYRGR